MQDSSGTVGLKSLCGGERVGRRRSIPRVKIYEIFLTVLLKVVRQIFKIK
jgi:hypothetical protein